MANVKEFYAWVEDGKVYIVPLSQKKNRKKSKSKSKELRKGSPVQIPLFGLR